MLENLLRGRYLALIIVVFAILNALGRPHAVDAKHRQSGSLSGKYYLMRGEWFVSGRIRTAYPRVAPTYLGVQYHARMIKHPPTVHVQET